MAGNVLDHLSNAPPNALLYDFGVDQSGLLSAHTAFISNDLWAFVEGLDLARQWSLDIVGMASNSGPAAYNEALGMRRAQAVKAAIERSIDSVRQGKIKVRPQSIGFERARQAGVAVGIGDIAGSKVVGQPAQQMERQSGAHRAVLLRFTDAVGVPGATIPGEPPGGASSASRPEYHYAIRLVSQVALSHAVSWGVGPAVDLLYHFEIKDAQGRRASYAYTGLGGAIGLPLDKVVPLLEQVKNGGIKFGAKAAQAATKLLRKVEPNIPQWFRPKSLLRHAFAHLPTVAGALGDVTVQPTIFAGPWNPFTHRSGPFVARRVECWAGAANLSGWFVPFADSLSFTHFNFGGCEGVQTPEGLRVRHAAQISGFQGGDTIGLPQASSTQGEMRLLAGPY